MANTTEFFAAIIAGDMATVTQFLDSDPSLANAETEQSHSATLVAVYNHEPQIADLLIDRGAVLNLFEASAAGQFELVQALVENNPASVNSYSLDGFAPIHLAVFFGHPDVVEYLLDHGSEVDSVSQNLMRVTPLHSAVAQRDAKKAYEFAHILVAHGADVNRAQEGGFTPLMAAAQNGNLSIVQLLIEHKADYQAKNINGSTALDLARAQMHDDVVHYLEALG